MRTTKKQLDYCIGCQWQGILKTTQFLTDDPQLTNCLHRTIAREVNKQMRAAFGKLNTHKLIVRSSQGRKYFAIKKLKQ